MLTVRFKSLLILFLLVLGTENHLRAQSNAQEVSKLITETMTLWFYAPSESLKTGRDALALALVIENDSLISDSYRVVGGSFYWLGKYDSAMVNYQQALYFAERSNYSRGWSAALNNIGLLQEHVGNYSVALEFLSEALLISERAQDQLAKASALNNLGLVYQRLRNYKEAQKHFHASLALKQNNKLPIGIAYSYNYLGDFQMDIHEFDSAKYYYNMAQEVCRSSNNLSGLATAIAGLGRFQESQNDFAHAITYYDEAIQIKEGIKEYVGIGKVYYYLARSYFRLGNYPKALSVLNVSLKYSFGHGALDQLSKNYKLMADIYTEMGKFDSANLYLAQHIQLKDSVFHEQMANSVEGVRLKAHTESARNEIALRDLEIQKKVNTNILLIISVILLLGVAILLFNRYRIKTEAHAILQGYNSEVLAQNEEIEAQKDDLLEKNNMLEQAWATIHIQKIRLEKLTEEQEKTIKERTFALKKANKGLEKSKKELDTFIYKTSHDIRGPLARLIGLSNVALMDSSDQKSLVYFEKLNQTANNLNAILTRLLSVNEINNMELIAESVQLSVLVDEIFANRHDMDKQLKIEMLNLVPEDIVLKTDRRLLKNVIYHLVENAVKFRNEMPDNLPQVSVSAYWKKSMLNIHVTDNGIGIPDKYRNSIFEMFSKANDNLETAGLGLFIVKMTVEKLKGNIEIISNADALTDFRLRLGNLT